MAAIDFRAIFNRPVTEEDTTRVLREFDGALETASQRDGGKVINLALRAWETFQSSGASSNTKVLMALALLYFIMPWDLIPDATPLLGYSDDALVLAYALGSLPKVADAARIARSKFRERYGLPS